MPSDDNAIHAHASRRMLAGREISDACARMIGSQYHEGGTSPSAQFASTGAITDPTEVWRDMFYDRHGFPMYASMDPAGQLAANMMGTYLSNAGARGPVPGWSALWINDIEADYRADLAETGA